MSKLILISGLALVAAVAPALAQGMGHGRMAPPSTRAEAETRVKAHFAKRDANGDGAVTQTEIKATHEKMKAERQEKHFAALDANKDGSISRAEFDTGHAAMKGKMAAHREKAHKVKGAGHGGPHAMREARVIEHADANKDMKVTLAEMSAATLDRFDRVDANKDGTITADERKAARQAMRDKHRSQM